MDAGGRIVERGARGRVLVVKLFRLPGWWAEEDILETSPRPVAEPCAVIAVGALHGGAAARGDARLQRRHGQVLVSVHCVARESKLGKHDFA